MSRGVLLIVAAVVLAAGVALVFLLGTGDEKASGSTASSPSAGSAVVVHTGTPTPTPSLGGGSAPTFATGDGEHPKDYVVGDIRVRDHRAGNNAPLDIPPNPHPAEGRAIQSGLTHEVAQKVKAVMMQCVADLPKDARGAKPRLEGQIKIAIKDKKVTITSALMQLRDIEGTPADTLKQCVESKSVGIENPAGEEADLEDYGINLTFAIP
jgi:hypothetical protein